jgi:hypothetical protein
MFLFLLCYLYKSIIFSSLAFCLLALGSCANSPLGQTVERSLQADPKLQSSPGVQGSSTAVRTDGNLDRPLPSPTEQVTSNPAVTATPNIGLDSAQAVPQPGDSDFIGPVLPGIATGSDTQTDADTQSGTNTQASADNQTSAPATASTTPSRFTDISQVPEELRPYITDLEQLGVLRLSSTSQSVATAQAFKPNQIITRREYARWLVAVNNQIFSDRPANRIRPSSTTAQPAFRDLPRSDPDFAAIQGLAEAGLIPSSLSGDTAAVTFRSNAPLTRENLILWKTPVDLRQTLPNATIQAVQQTWGFQDAARIEPKALKAVLADYQNGDLSNIRRAFGYTTLFQPKKTVTRAEAAAVLWYFGSQGEGASAKDALQRGG